MTIALRHLTAAILVVGTASCASGPRSYVDAAEPAIRSELDSMLAGWKADNIDRHLAPYADDASWTTATGLMKGKAAIRESLAKAFLRGTDLVGDLTFGPTEFRRLGPDYMMTNGSFHLENLPNGRVVNGQSTLIWRKGSGNRWFVIHDHSS